MTVAESMRLPIRVSSSARPARPQKFRHQSKMRATIPNREEIAPDTPLRLGVAAALAFPDGSMTASGLRREGARGRLTIERIAGKDFTTLAHIADMRKKCRVPEKAPACGSALPDHGAAAP